MTNRLLTLDQWKFFGILPRADRPLAVAWWGVLVFRGILPALFAIAMGLLVGAVQRNENILPPLALVALVFLPLQVLSPLHHVIGANLGSRTASWLYDRLARTCVEPPGMGHLENPAPDDRPLHGARFRPRHHWPADTHLDGFHCLWRGRDDRGADLGGRAGRFFVVGSSPPRRRLAGHSLALARECRMEGPQHRGSPAAQRHADYAYRLAVEPHAAKELRLFGLADWAVDRFRACRRKLFDLQWQATRLRERPLVWSLVLVVSANLVVFWALAAAAESGTLPLDRLVTFAAAAVMTSTIAFGGLSWALDCATAPVAATLRLDQAMGTAGELTRGSRTAQGMPAHEICFRDLTFAYPLSGEPVLKALNLTVPAGTSLAIVGQNGAGKTTLAKLLCRLYDPQSGTIEVDGTDLRQIDLTEWRSRVTAVFQDFIRFELPLRDNVAPASAPDDVIRAALADAGAAGLTDLDTILARGYEGGTELSGGQWQRVALARALCAVRQGAGLVLLDEPTAQLDVRGEAEIFERILAATRRTTTILISHRFSTVRHADRICVLEGGRVVELGTHDELMAAGGRYRTMFDLQASRFSADEAEEEGVQYDVLT